MTHTHTYKYIYIYIKGNIYIYIYIYIHTYIYIYLYNILCNKSQSFARINFFRIFIKYNFFFFSNVYVFVILVVCYLEAIKSSKFWELDIIMFLFHYT